MTPGSNPIGRAKCCSERVSRATHRPIICNSFRPPYSNGGPGIHRNPLGKRGGRGRAGSLRVATMDDERADWTERRRQAIAGHEAALEAGRAAEAREAAALLHDFV